VELGSHHLQRTTSTDAPVHPSQSFRATETIISSGQGPAAPSTISPCLSGAPTVP